MAFSEKELKRRRARLDHADEVWKRAGFHDDSNPDISAKRYLDAYRGDQWGFALGTWESIESELTTDNLMFSTMNVLMASLYARHPVVDVFSVGSGEQKDNATRQEKLVNFTIQNPKLKMKREANRALFNGLLLNMGILRHGFTPEEQKFDDNGDLIDTYDPAKPEFPWIRNVNPWDIRIDPLADSLHPDEARWVAFRSLHFLDDLKKNPLFIARRDLKPTRRLDDESFRKRREDRLSQEANEIVEVWTVYDKTDRTMYALSPGSDKEVIEERDWPIPWTTLPYNLLQFNATPDDPFGTSYGAQVMPLQVQINKGITLLSRLALSLRRVIGYDKGAVEPEQQEILENLGLLEFVQFNGDPRAAMHAITAGGLDQGLMLFVQFLKEELRGTLGVGEMERANRVNVETATEASGIQQGALAQRGRNQGPWEDFLSEVFSIYGVALQSVLDQTILVPILGTEEADSLLRGEGGSPFETVKPEEIQGEFLYRVRPGSTLPRNPNEEIIRANALLQSVLAFGENGVELANLPQLMVDVFRSNDKDPAIYMQSIEKLLARRQVGEQQTPQPNGDGRPAAGGGGGAGGGVDVPGIARALGEGSS